MCTLRPSFTVAWLLTVLLAATGNLAAQSPFVRGSVRGTPQVNGVELDADGLFFVIERSEVMAASGELASVKRQLLQALLLFTPDTEFAMVFFDRNVLQFPHAVEPARGTRETLLEASNFVRAAPGGIGRCLHAGLRAALQFAGASSARRKLIVVLSTLGFAVVNVTSGRTLESVLQELRAASSDC